MNFGRCPYDDCDGFMMLELPDADLPKYILIDCEHCQREIWYKLSRLSPEAWTRDAFEAEFSVDHDTHEIRKRDVDNQQKSGVK